MSEENALPEGFEEPTYGAGKFENWSLKDGQTSTLRILPAMKSLRKRRDYGQFWYTHFWTGADPKNPGKRKSHPILCIQEKDFRNGGIVTKRCPLCEKRQQFKDKAEKISAKGKEQGRTKAEIAKALQPTNLWLKDHGHDGKWRVYAVNKQGQLGVLRITHTCMKSLRQEVGKLTARDMTPMGVKGVFWDFSRTGKGFDTKDTVEPHRITRPDGSEVIETHVFTKELATAALADLPDFDEEMDRIRYPEAVLEALAACNDDPEEVNRILGIRGSEESSGGGGDSWADEGASAAPSAGGDDDFAVGGDSEPATTEKKEEPAPAAAEEEDEDEKVLKALLAKKAAKAAATKPAEAPKAKAEAPKTMKQEASKPAASVPGGSDDEFDNLFGG